MSKSRASLAINQTMLLVLAVVILVVLGDWIVPDLDVECIKIKAEGYSDYKPNFCYERK